MPRRAYDPERHFRTDHLRADLKARAARGGVLAVGSQGVKFCFSMAATIVLARLLTPADYGLIGMVAVVTGFVSLFKDMGLSQATVQREEVTAAQVSTLFWINVVVSAAAMFVTAALAPAVAWLYGEPRLTLITVGYAAGFIFGGLSVQHEALLRRQMRFGALDGGGRQPHVLEERDEARHHDDHADEAVVFGREQTRQHHRRGHGDHEPHGLRADDDGAAARRAPPQIGLQVVGAEVPVNGRAGALRASGETFQRQSLSIYISAALCRCPSET